MTLSTNYFVKAHPFFFSFFSLIFICSACDAHHRRQRTPTWFRHVRVTGPPSTGGDGDQLERQPATHVTVHSTREHILQGNAFYKRTHSTWEHILQDNTFYVRTHSTRVQEYTSWHRAKIAFRRSRTAAWRPCWSPWFALFFLFLLFLLLVGGWTRLIICIFFLVIFF